MSRNGGPPLYRQVENHLRELIGSDRLRPGDRLPSELELADTLGVHRLTVRQAIAELRRAGELHVRQGSGTFVAQRPMDLELSVSPPLSAETVRSKVADAFTVLDRTAVERAVGWELIGASDADGAVPRRHLGAARNAQLWRFDRVLHVDGEPWVASSYWLRRSRFTSLPRRWTDDTGLNELLAEQYGIRPHYGWRVFSAAAPTDDDRTALDLPAGLPLLVREGVNVDEGGDPVFYVHRRCRSDKVRFLYRYST